MAWLRNAFVRGWDGHSDDPRAAGPRGCEDDRDSDSRGGGREWVWGEESAEWVSQSAE